MSTKTLHEKVVDAINERAVQMSPTDEVAELVLLRVAEHIGMDVWELEEGIAHGAP